ncbi:hypothetical protein [Mycolicibacterium fortuitum]|uniref:hypothetical protein n=1 Tax=Mycolicibacterium fortuitum TaxID=1766 RepID=UPI000AEE32CE|nr:hypothetical protein [Mycolicibacterium fortuitum]
MTFVIAKIIDREAGKITLLADTKLTDRNDDTHNRRTLANPGQKVVIVDDDVVVGFAGDTPKSALEKIVELRGQSPEAIEDALLSFTTEMQNLAGVSKTFLVISKKPTLRITVIGNGNRQDRTGIGTGWVGDAEAFKAFSAIFQSPAAQAIADLGARFFMAMVHLIASENVETVGGYLVRVSGSPSQPFRFAPDPGFVLPTDLDATLHRQRADEPVNVHLSLPEGADPTHHVRLPVPGTGPTYSALAHYIPEAATAWLHTHEQPWSVTKLAVQSLSELVDLARANHHQILDGEITQAIMDQL